MLGQLVLRPHLNLGEGDALGHGGDQGLLLRDLVPQLADLLLTLGPFLYRETTMEMGSNSDASRGNLQIPQENGVNIPSYHSNIAVSANILK